MALFRVEPFWQVMLSTLGLAPGTLARRAGLTDQIFSPQPEKVDLEGWAALWDALAKEVPRPTLALEIGQALSFDAFDPALFATHCAANLREAAERLARYKPLIGPCRLRLAQGRDLAIGCDVVGMPYPPALWGLAELVVWVSLARHCTATRIVPKRVRAPVLPSDPMAYTAFFGVPITPGPRFEVLFWARDAERPFEATDASRWQFFEPVLTRRLTELKAETPTRERVRAALFELLPTGQNQLAQVAKRLAMSSRSLQRRLAHEGTTFRKVLEETRAQLATHYLKQSELTSAEIAFLLGYDDPNSFFPAFRAWTGITPEALRAASP
jgi:AraC-like DNA-binding protein